MDILQKVIVKDDVSKLKSLLKLYYYKHLLVNQDSHGFTPLMFAIHKNKIECAFICLKGMKDNYYHHINVVNALNKRDTSGRQFSALHFAANNGCFKLVCEIIKAGANPRLIDSHGHTPASLALSKSQSRGKRYEYISYFLNGVWIRKDWNHKLHLSTPYEFQEQVYEMLCVFCRKEKEWRFKIYNDVKFCLFNKLLKLYKIEYKKILCIL